MKFKKILLIHIEENKLDKEYWEKLRSLTNKVVSLGKDDNPNKELADTDCLLVNFGIPVTKENMDAAPNLKYIGVLATAYGKVDIEEAKKRGIVVCNLPGYSTESVAEFTIAAILESIRDLEKGKEKAREGDYSGAGFSAKEIKNKVFGIFGLGSIGGRAAEIALGFGADVRYWSRNRKKEFEKKGIKYEEADRLIPKCDFISLHFAQTEDTENFLNAKRINKIKKGAVVINTAPMELVDLDALEKRLRRKDITFILDHSDEMSENDLKKLSKYSNCIIYPPIAYVSEEARIAKQEIFVGNIENFLKGSPSNNVT
jgi:lactate dehydrogenase-like 2-hydroxyacid dehydrogenase